MMRGIESREGLGKFVKDADLAKAGLAKLLIQGAKSWRELYGDIPLPGQTTPAKESQAPKVDLRQQMIDLLPFLVEPTDDEKRELREKRGLVFLPMTSQSYAQVIAEAPNHFWDKELEYANTRPALRDFRPPVAVEVGLIEAELALPDSFRKPRATALQMIDEYSKVLATEFPGFMAIALPVTGYANADKAYAERNPGQVLFKNYFAWGLDNLSEGDAAYAGRRVPSLRFFVYEWRADFGRGGVGAVPAVVFVGNK